MGDRMAAARAIEFQLGWFGDPIFKVLYLPQRSLMLSIRCR